MASPGTRFWLRVLTEGHRAVAVVECRFHHCHIALSYALCSGGILRALPTARRTKSDILRVRSKELARAVQYEVIKRDRRVNVGRYVPTGGVDALAYRVLCRLHDGVLRLTRIAH